jgi:hypothetical protein
MKVSYFETGRYQAPADTSSTPALSTGCLLDTLKRVSGRSMTLGLS